jgi:hypothetical protein
LPQQPWFPQPQLWPPQQSKPNSPKIFACVVAGVNEIAANTAATVNKWRIGRFLVYVGELL